MPKQDGLGVAIQASPYVDEIDGFTDILQFVVSSQQFKKTAKPEGFNVLLLRNASGPKLHRYTGHRTSLEADLADFSDTLLRRSATRPRPMSFHLKLKMHDRAAGVNATSWRDQHFSVLLTRVIVTA
jgi:hypothetical protein